ARGGQVFLRLADGVFAKVENARGQHRVGTALQHAVNQVLQVADAAGGNHRHRHRIADRARQGDIEAVFGAVAVHAGEQDFTGAVVGHAGSPFDRVDAGGLAAAVGENLPAV